jgi:hypothetical protein
MLVRLNYDKILKVDHEDLVLAFIEQQVEQFDDFHKAAEDAVNAETVEGDANDPQGSRHTATITSSESGLTVALGSKQKPSTIGEFLEEQSTDPAFTNFCSRISLAIQALSSEPEDTIAINDSHQVRRVLSPSFISH